MALGAPNGTFEPNFLVDTGVTALESAGLTVDPATQQLRKLPAVPLKQGRSTRSPPAQALSPPGPQAMMVGKIFRRASP